MPNWFAWLALAVWPLVVLATYAARRTSARLARTTAWMMVLPVMFLPSGPQLKVSGIPYLDKHRLGFVSIAIALQLFHRHDLLGKARWHQFPRLVLLALIGGAVGTVYTNRDALAFGPNVLPGLTSYDVVSISGARVLDLYLPFAVGQRVFRTERDLRDLMEVLSLCGLVYAPLCLFELRMSPQLHYWIYGTTPSQFAQAIRGGGYRPIVFMSHGLSVAMFLFACLCAALALRAVRATGGPVTAGSRATLTGLLLVACKSLASIIYSGVALVVHLALSSKSLARVLAVCVALIAAYPVAQVSNVFPSGEVVRFFYSINPDRAESLWFRMRHESALVARARERPFFGWGTFGRNRIYDDESGQDLSVTDGTWIIQFGEFGYVGLAVLGALMLVPVLRFTWSRARMPETAQALGGALAFMVVIFTINLFPNSYADALPVAYAGALFTLANTIRRPRPARRMSAQRRVAVVREQQVNLLGG
jgi:hypothetical protein